MVDRAVKLKKKALLSQYLWFLQYIADQFDKFGTGFIYLFEYLSHVEGKESL